MKNCHTLIFPYRHDLRHLWWSALSAQPSNPRAVTMSFLKLQYPRVIAVALQISSSLGGDFAKICLVCWSVFKFLQWCLRELHNFYKFHVLFVCGHYFVQYGLIYVYIFYQFCWKTSFLSFCAFCVFCLFCVKFDVI